MNVYYCLNPDLSIAETCYESIDNNTDANISEEDDDFSIDDGACCEDSQRSAICCIVTLNKALALK